MNKRNIARNLGNKLSDWISSIDSPEIRKIARDNVLITGGSIVSLLQNEDPKDFDVYFKTKESLIAVAKYYIDIWNKEKNDSVVLLDLSNISADQITENGISAMLSELAGQNRVYARTEGHNSVSDTEILDSADEEIDTPDNPKEKNKYKPQWISANAITLTNKIQIVLRFFGDVNEIHKNYDFIHCTCSYDYNSNIVNLPGEALESIINKQLIYVGSKYPLCSIFRTRKFLKRGWTINAGQYLKMALQLNELNLKNYYTLYDQLVGVDSAHFMSLLDKLSEWKTNNPDSKLENTVLFEIVNEIFG